MRHGGSADWASERSVPESSDRQRRRREGDGCCLLFGELVGDSLLLAELMESSHCSISADSGPVNGVGWALINAAICNAAELKLLFCRSE